MSTDRYDEGSAWTGWVIFAAAVMFTIGAIDIIQGITALAKDGTYVIPESGLLVTTNFTTWGWALIIWGIVMMLAAGGALRRQGVGPLVRHRRDHHQRHRPDRLVPGLPAVEPARHRARDRRPVRAHRGLEVGEGRPEGLRSGFRGWVRGLASARPRGLAGPGAGHGQRPPAISARGPPSGPGAPRSSSGGGAARPDAPGRRAPRRCSPRAGSCRSVWRSRRRSGWGRTPS